MNRTIVYREQEYTVYGWKQKTVSLLHKKTESRKQEPGLFAPGPVTFSCPVTLAPGSCFTVKETREIFEIVSSEINLHTARKTGEEKKRQAKAAFLACPQ